PPSSISSEMRVLPASIALSRSSLTTEPGRSITSPAAMRAASSGGRTRIDFGFSILDWGRGQPREWSFWRGGSEVGEGAQFVELLDRFDWRQAVDLEPANGL